jgi:hypothetical protein
MASWLWAIGIAGIVVLLAFVVWVLKDVVETD